MDEQKETLRAMYREIRLRMRPSEVSTKSRMINRKLINGIDWNQYQTICAFNPITSLNEVDIRPLLKRLDKLSTLEVKIIQGSKIAKMPTEKFDLILVPVLAFDDDNYRLGWGGGWYDKFLVSQPQALKIGLCFQNGYVKKLPHELHDIPLDQVITEL